MSKSFMVENRLLHEKRPQSIVLNFHGTISPVILSAAKHLPRPSQKLVQLLHSA